MSASTKLSLAVKALSFLAANEQIPKQSNEIAEFINCNGSKLRQLLSKLTKAQILESTQGKNGGFSLKKEAQKIHLQEIYCAIEHQKAFHINWHNCGNPENQKIDRFFENLFTEIQFDIEEKMSKISLENIIKKEGHMYGLY